MIRYTLVCTNEHDFEVWFRDSATCDAQLAAAEVPCPFCGSSQVAKALMAPSVVSGRGKDARRAETLSLLGRALAAAAQNGAEATPAPPAPLPAPPPAAVPTPTPAATAPVLPPSPVAEALRELRRHVEETCEDVGERFAEEARLIHYGEADERPIHGSATLEDAKALHEEGINVALLPWTRRVEN
ncbi:DUF1178 family protein [Pararhodospirillum photometricum]|nr:DUF1178 family protein [Pararhodospirillum photometricum]